MTSKRTIAAAKARKVKAAKARLAGVKFDIKLVETRVKHDAEALARRQEWLVEAESDLAKLLAE